MNTEQVINREKRAKAISLRTGKPHICKVNSRWQVYCSSRLDLPARTEEKLRHMLKAYFLVNTINCGYKTL